jgi:hypothetical protein
MNKIKIKKELEYENFKVEEHSHVVHLYFFSLFSLNKYLTLRKLERRRKEKQRKFFECE